MPFLLLGLLLGIEFLNRALDESAQREDAAHQRQVIERLRLEQERVAARESGRLHQSLAALDAVVERACTDPRWRAELDRVHNQLSINQNTHKNKPR